VDVISLGFRTDLMVRRLGGSTVTDKGDHLVVRTPDNPTFYWGNFLLLDGPPAGDEAARWVETFNTEFPSAGHVAIGIDGVDGATGDIRELLAAGFEVENDVVLTARQLTGADACSAVEVRRLSTDTDWAQAVEVRLAIDESDDRAHVDFVERKLAESRALVEAGHGAYVGAVVDGQVRAALGIFTDGSGVARYQNVETHPDHRRKGLATALLRSAAGIALTELGAETLVIVADAEYVAIGLYRGLGFADVERQVHLQRAP